MIETDKLIPYEKMRNETLALMFADYVRAVSRAGGFKFQIPRKAMIDEIEIMAEWLRENQKVQQSMNGGRQL